RRGDARSRRTHSGIPLADLVRRAYDQQRRAGDGTGRRQDPEQGLRSGADGDRDGEFEEGLKRWELGIGALASETIPSLLSVFSIPNSHPPMPVFYGTPSTRARARGAGAVSGRSDRRRLGEVSGFVPEPFRGWR